MILPKNLEPGDTIKIVAPAKAIDLSLVTNAQKMLEDMGFNVELGKHFDSASNYFSGSISERLNDFQEALDDENSKMILCARGGYGCMHLIERVNWSSLLLHPKWVVGFSDVTFLHQKIQQLGICSVHATMPLNFEENSEASFSTLFHAVKNEAYQITTKANRFNKQGFAQGKLIGGNLSVLYATLATANRPTYDESILFIEDVGEPLYHIDRMFNSLSQSGALENIRGLIIGGITEVRDTAQPYGLSLEEIVLSHFPFRKIPICFDFPAGHVTDNRALKLGAKVDFSVDADLSSILRFF